MANNKVPYRLERFNKNSDEWEVFYTHSLTMAKRFLDDSPSDVFTSVGYLENPPSDWLHTFRYVVGCFVPEYTPGADYAKLRTYSPETL